MWGATPCRRHLQPSSTISIHAPVWGATVAAKEEATIYPISIHAPVWGATVRLSDKELALLFQSTRPCGARHALPILILRRSSHFNPRARVGRDRFILTRAARMRHFNPRARVGRDICEPTLENKAGISIHAPVWGATACIGKRDGASRISIHAPVWGATTFKIHASCSL